MRRFVISAYFLLAAAATAAQGIDYAGFVRSLRAENTTIEPQGEVEQPFFSVTGKVIALYGDRVQIFEYPGSAEAGAQAALVSPDGMTVGTAKPHWLGTPHFYRKDRLLVLYLGDDEKVLKALEARLGRQFAGG
jgi:hypothetical protein